MYISQYKLIFVILISLFIHELFHVITYIFFKRKNHETYFIDINFSIFGGIAKFDFSSFNKIQRILLFISGICGNIFLIVIFLNFDFYNDIVKYNLMLIIFNLLPIYPLDGYNILKEWKISLKGYFKILFIVSLFLLLISLIYKSFGIALILIFLLIKNINIKEELMKLKINILRKKLKECNYDIVKLKKI